MPNTAQKIARPLFYHLSVALMRNYTFKKYSGSLLLLLFWWNMAELQAQTPDSSYVTEADSNNVRLPLPKWYKGFNVSARVGDPAHVEFSPLLGRQINDKFSGGVGLSYLFFQETGAQKTKHSTNLFGGRVFMRYNLLSTLFAHTEYEILNTSYFSTSEATFRRRWIGSPFTGIGYRLPIGYKMAVTFMGLYNLNFKPVYSPYNSAFIVRGGFIF